MSSDADSTLRRILRMSVRFLLIIYFVFAAVFLSLRYFVLPNISEYKSDIERIVSESAGRNISISRIDASWSGFRPLLNLENVVVHDLSGRVALELPKVTAVVAWRSLPAFDLRFHLLEINQPDLHIRRDQEGHFYIAGMLVDTSKKEDRSSVDWILKQDKIVILDGKVRWLDERRGNSELLLDQVQFVMQNNGRHHRFRLDATPPSTFSDPIDIRADFVHPFFAQSISDITTWKGDLYVDLSRANLRSWKQYLDFPIDIENGLGSLRTWFSFDRTRITNFTADIGLTDVALQFAKALPQLNLNRVSGRISAQELFEKDQDEDNLNLEDRTLTVSLADMSLETKEGIVMAETTVSGKHTPGKNKKPAQVEIYAEKLELSAFVNLAKYLPLRDVQRQLLSDFSPSGILHDFTIRWQGGFSEIIAYQLNGNFSELSIKGQTPNPEQVGMKKIPVHLEIAGIPGFKNLTGSVVGNEREGQITIDSKDFVLHLPGYYQNPARLFNTLQMQAKWAYLPDNQFSLAISKMNFEREGLIASLVGDYKQLLGQPEKIPGTINATAKIKHFDMGKIGNYLPLQTPKTLSDWLIGALKEGIVSDAEVRIKGNLADFPFQPNKPGEKEKGVFSVKAKIEDAVLNYAPNEFVKGSKTPLWPHIEDIQGQLTINGSQLIVYAERAKISDVRLAQVTALIPDMLADKTMLNIVGNADGALQNFIRFVNSTPILNWIGQLTAETKTSGDANLNLKMQMPLDHLASSKVQGVLQFLNNDILLFKDLPMLSRSQGKVHFYEKGFKLDDIQAQFLGNPVSLAGGTQSNGLFQVLANGKLSPEGLRSAYPVDTVTALTKRLSGSAKYTVTIRENAGFPDVLVESDLQGLGLDFPAPLGKKANEKLALRLHKTPLLPATKTERDEIRVSLGQAISAHYQRQRAVANQWTVTQGSIGVNMEPTLRQGIALNVSLHAFDLSAWQSAIDSFTDTAPSNNKKSNNNQVQGFSIAQYIEPKYVVAHLDELNLMNMLFTNVKVTGTRQPGVWQSDVRSDQINGKMTWNDSTAALPNGQLIARLASLNIPSSSTIEKVRGAIDNTEVSRLPALDIQVNDFTIFGKRLGRTELVANNVAVPNGREWRIDKLNISNPDARLQSSGRWTTTRAGANVTSMNYAMDITDAGKLLARFGFPGVIKSGEGNMKGKISWNGLPFSLDIPSLSGDVLLDVNSGQFLKVDMTAVNLLGILSMQSIPRRLTLDFKDVFSEGFSFDTANANAVIKNGILSTENFKMRGVSATVLMNGNVDVVNESQNLHVVVIPELNIGTASVLYGLAINPAIGIGTFLAQLFLREPLMRSMTFEYQITGSWDNPNVKKIERSNDNQ